MAWLKAGKNKVAAKQRGTKKKDTAKAQKKTLSERQNKNYKGKAKVKKKKKAQQKKGTAKGITKKYKGTAEKWHGTKKGHSKRKNQKIKAKCMSAMHVLAVAAEQASQYQWPHISRYTVFGHWNVLVVTL